MSDGFTIGSDLPAPPDWLLEYLPQGQSNNKNGSTDSDATSIKKGERNTTLASYGGTFRRRGSNEQEIFELLKIINESRCKPPLPIAEVQGIARSVARYDPDYGYNFTDYGNAERLVALYGGYIRFCADLNRWLAWDGTRWQVDAIGKVKQFAKKTIRSIYTEASLESDDSKRRAKAKWAMRSESQAAIGSMISLAESEPGIAVTADALDTDPWLLNVQNGTIDLRTGEIREHRPESLITKVIPVEYDPSATYPRWKEFLEQIMNDNQELIRFLKKAIGYSLTGVTTERVMFMCHGDGANGKSTFLRVIMEMLNDYALRTPTETLMAKQSWGIPNDVARLKGARFVTAIEGEEGQRLAESFIKQITGNDKISARFMRAEWFDFFPEFKLWFATNHKPEIQSTDKAIWDRMRLVPFDVTIPDDKQDKQLIEKLKSELPGILRWAVEGCMAWQGEGLGLPQAVKNATNQYRAETDNASEFLEDWCEAQPQAMVPLDDFYKAYQLWCQMGEQSSLKKIKFNKRVQECGYEKRKSGVWYWVGIQLKEEFAKKAKDFSHGAFGW